MIENAHVEPASFVWLYPTAIVLHTGTDFIAALNIFHVVSLSPWALEGIAAVFGSLVFFGAYLLLYRKDERIKN